MISGKLVYTNKNFKEIDFSSLVSLHPTRNGIFKHNDKIVSIQIVIDNEPGYVDGFENNGDILLYKKSFRKDDNTYINKLQGNSDYKILVYLNARRGFGGYWMCGEYVVQEFHSWGWILKRKNRSSS